MQPLEKARKVTIVVGHAPHASTNQTCMRILEHLGSEGAVNVVAYRAMSAIDSAGKLHSMRLAEVTPDLPIVVVWIDSSERVERILPTITGLVAEGIITVEETDVALYATTTVPDLPPAVTVGDMMTREVVAVQPETPMSELVADLIERGFRAVPVVDADRTVIGIVTNGDLVRRGGLPVRLELLQTFDSPAVHEQLQRLSAVHRSVREVMTAPAVTVTPDLDVRHAAELMLRRRLKRLPVTDGAGRLVGIVSRVDLLHTVAGASRPVTSEASHPLTVQGATPVRNVMSTIVPTVSANTPLPQVVNAVAATRLNRVVVVDDARRVLGIITDAELVERLTPQARPKALTVLMHRIPFVHGSAEIEEMLRHTTGQTARDVMIADVPTSREDEPVRDVLATMLAKGKKIVPIVNAGGVLTGMVDRADLLRALIEA
jgi:CBS-domain-containing membrane protein